MPTVSLEISEKKEAPRSFSIKINGKEVADSVCSLCYEIEAGHLPTLTMCSVVEGVQLSRPSVYGLPKVYQLCLESETHSETENGCRSMDVLGIYDGIGTETAHKKSIICENFIKKTSQMNGFQLACFLSDFHFEGFDTVLTFKIPPSTEFIEGFLSETKRK